MTESHAVSPEPEHPPTPAEEAAAMKRLREHAARAAQEPERPAPEPVDWEARVLQIADRSRPHRQAQAEARTRREAILREQRADRARTLNRERSARQVPARYREARPDHPEVARWARDVAHRDTTDGLVLNGPTGCGKTWQAYGAWAFVAQHTGCRAIALSVPAYLESLRPGRVPTVSLDDAESAELLLLDDLAAERSSEWTTEVVYRLIDARWNACLPTIVTVNAPIEELPNGKQVSTLRERLGDRIASRLNGLGRIVSWPSDAPDRRTRPNG